MRRIARFRRATKWIGAAVTLLLFIAWIASGWWACRWLSGGGLEIRIARGEFYTNWSSNMFNNALGWRILGPFDAQWRWWFDIDDSFLGQTLGVPLWLPALLALSATLVLWRRDARSRKRERGLCQKCNYDRAGIAGDAKCPECGAMSVGR